MLPFIPSLLLLLVLLAAPALLTPSTYSQLQVRGQRTARDAKQDSIKVVVSEDWVTQGDSSDGSQREKAINLTPGSPLVLTHRIRLVPSSGSGSGSCGCGADFAALRERLERLEREVSTLREKCGGAEGGCCTSKESKGPGCSIKPEVDCPNECSDQGRCAAGRCVCFPGFTGLDCSESNCPGNCNDNGRCVNGKCACDPGFTGADCARTGCPDNCSNRGRCVNGKCACDGGFAGPSCSDESCPGNCNSRGRCVSGKCVCDPGFTGVDCSQASCPGDCTSRGRCVDGTCACDPGSTGPDCSQKTCPDNCSDRGRCVDGRCICDDGFTGDDCGDKSCPGDCSSRGRCVDGRCVCDDGFTGDNCADKSCPGDCSSRGRCVDGECVCDDGFTGADCSGKACPSNCSGRGKCVNGKCVCNVGFAGPDCAKGCPGNCGGKGRCVKGRCVCRRGFTGPDCSQCEEGMSGPNCDTAMSGVSQLSTRDITETSVTLHWTPPRVQYETYYITFTSQKDSDQQIAVQVEGGRSSFTQTGLAAGQGYTVSVTGEAGGRKGAESAAEFMTLTSGPANLQVVKTTSTSAVVQWEQSQGEIDSYRLTVTPNGGAGRSQEMTVPAGQDSAHIQQLEAGRLYDVVLVAEKGTSRSKPATTQVTPGKTLSRVTTAALTLAPGRDVGAGHQEVSDQQGRREEGKIGGADGPHNDSATSVIARTKPLVSKKMGINGTLPKVMERSAFYRKPNVSGPFRSNTTRVVSAWRQFGPGPLKRPPVGQKKKATIVPKKPKPGVPTIGDGTIALTRRDPAMEASSIETRVDKNPALTSGTDSDTNRQSSSEEPTVAVGSKEQPDVGEVGQGNDTAPVSTEPTGTAGSQEKKCMNKVKVTHVRLPHRVKGIAGRGDGTVLVVKTAGSDQGSPETDDLKPSSAEMDLDDSPDPLHKLLTDTFDSLNITTFTVHLSKQSNVPANAEMARKQILKGLRPLSPSSSWSSTSHSSSSARSSSSSSLSSPSLGPSPSTVAPSPPRSSSHSLGEPSSLPSSPSSLASPSLAPSSAAASSSSSLTLLMSSPSSLPSPPSSSRPSLSPLTPSPSLSSSDKSGSVRSNEPDVDNRKSATDVSSPEDIKLPPSGPLFQRTPAKHGYVRRLRPNFGLFLNKSRLNLRVPHPSTPRLNLAPKRGSETRHTSTSELSSSPSSSASLPESSIEVNAPARGTSGEEDGATPTTSTGVEQNQKKKPTERGRIPVRRLPPKGVYLLRRPNFGALQNRTRPNLRVLPPPSRPLNPVSDTRREQVSSTELPATSSPVSKESYPVKGMGPIVAENVENVETTMSSTGLSTEFNRTLRGSGVPSSHRPINKVDYLPRLQLYGGRFQNKTRTNLRPPQHPHKGPVRKLFPNKKPSGSSIVGGRALQLEKYISPENQSGGHDTPMSTQGVQIRQSGEQDTAEVIPLSQMDGDDTTVRPQINELEGRDDAPVQTTKSGEETTSTPDANSDSHKERVNTGKKTGATSRGGPTVKQTSSDFRHEAQRPPMRGTTAQRYAQIRPYTNGRKRKEETKTNGAAKSVDSKPQTGSTGSSSGVTREPLDHVGVTNRSSDGFTLVWDSQEEKYKHFVVTSREVGKEEDSEGEGGNEEEEAKHHPTKETESENGRSEDENRVQESASMQGPTSQSNTRAKPVPGSDKTFKKVLPGSARSFQFESLPPQTEYTVTLLGKGPGLLSRLHKLVISTGPEPPTDIVFSEVTDTSLTVSWTKPKTPVSGFKVTYTHIEEGEPVSVSVDSGDSSLGLSTLAPGSSYEVSVVSVLGLDESDPVRELVATLPDPPTDLRVVNVTDTKALLLWRPALAAVDNYVIVYGAGTDSELRISVSGNAAEQQLSGLEASSTYTLTISSQQGGAESREASTRFTTTGGSSGPRDLQAHDVTPRTALLSWKLPSNPASSYRLTYQGEGQERKEVAVDASLTEYKLTRLHPGSKYAVQLRAEGGDSAAIATDFTTGTLRFPFPTDCSQELLNGVRTSGEVEVFPQGKLGTPIMVSCDMETDGGGWTVFQRRKDGSVDFFRGWKDYTKGFGSPSGEFWLGLESLYNLTSMTRMSLRVDLRDKNEAVFAKYSKFELVKRNYKLIVGGYSGTAGDSLSYHSDRIFSTRDRDLAPFITRCAMSYRGGWWYKNCHEANLNGAYGTDFNHQGVIWTAWKGTQYSIPFTEMKMRPAAFSPPTRG